MILKTLRVQNFRTHSDFILEIGEKSTLISGANGSGKTSLLNAIANHIERIANDRNKSFEVYKSQIEYFENELKDNPQNTLSIEPQLQYYKNEYELFFW